MNKYSKIIIFLKLCLSFIQMGTGFFVLFIGYGKLKGIISYLVSFELAEDSTDFISTTIVKISEAIPLDAGHIIGIYLILEGLSKIFILYGIMKHKIRVFHIAFLLFGGLLLYQLGLLISGSSLYISFLLVFDIILLLVLTHEYKRLQK